MQPYIFLDAGWTLVFPDYGLLRRVTSQRGYDIAQARWERVMAEFTWYYDDARKHGHDRWDLVHFLTWVLKQAGVEQEHIPPIVTELQAADAEKSLWCYAYPWAYETLERLAAQGYHLSVISNADGRVRRGFEGLGLARYFEEIFDSHIVGYAKPDPRLFQHAMTQVGVRPAECLYVGDLYYVDVLGANGAGMAAIHLDPYGLYDGWPGVHIPNVTALPDLLAQDLDLGDARFFPLR